VRLKAISWVGLICRTRQ